jgi:hypothetical protein
MSLEKPVIQENQAPEQLEEQEEPEDEIHSIEDNLTVLEEDMERLTSETPGLMLLAQKFTEAKNSTPDANDLVQVNMDEFDSLVNNPPVQNSLREVNYENLRKQIDSIENHYTENKNASKTVTKSRQSGTRS